MAILITETWLAHGTPPLEANNPHRSGGVETFSMDDPPENLTPEMIERIRRQREEIASRGYRDFSEEMQRSYSVEGMKHLFEPPESVVPRLSPRVNRTITSSVYGPLVLEGLYPITNPDIDVIYGVARIYTVSDGSFLMVKETDLDVGMRTVLLAESINERIHGYPAALHEFRSKDGEALYILTWATPEKKYVIFRRFRERSTNERGMLLEFAHSLD